MREKERERFQSAMKTVLFGEGQLKDLISSASSFSPPPTLQGFCVQRLQVTICHLWSTSLPLEHCFKKHLTVWAPRTLDGSSVNPLQVYIQITVGRVVITSSTANSQNYRKTQEECISITGEYSHFSGPLTHLGSHVKTYITHRARWKGFWVLLSGGFLFLFLPLCFLLNHEGYY